MAGGATAGGFAAGFARGLANTLLANKQEATRKRERQEEVDFRNFQTTLPIVFQNFQQNPTPEGAAALEDMLVKINPDLKKQIKRSGFSFETLGPLLSQLEGSQQPGGGQQQPSRQPIPEWLGALPQQNPSIGDPSQAQPLLEAKHGAMVGMPDPTVRLFGAPVQTAEQRATAEITKGQRLSEAEIQGKVDAARRLLSTGAAKTMAEALDRVGLRQTTSGAASAMRYGGVLKGDQAPAGTLDNSGRPLDPNQYYRTQIQANGELMYTPTVPPGGAGGGDFLTRAAIKLGFRNAAEVPVEKREEMFKLASQIETEESRASALGTGQGQFQAPIDLKTAQEVPGAVVGSSSADYAGQQPGTQAQVERRRTAELIKGQLETIKPLLKVLPSKNELGGLLPGAANAARSRLPATREGYAQLQSAINNIRAALTRTMQENRGTETELDSQRALTTLADFEGSLFDPARGDTQESALVRLNETIAYLEKVMSTMPGPVVPNQPGAAGAGAGAAGTGAPGSQQAPPATGFFTDDQGNIYRDGKIIVPAR